MPQLPEADGSEWKEGEGSWKKPHFGGGRQHRELEQRRNYSDLVMDESRRSVSDGESMTSGNTDEGELELIKVEDRSNSPTGGGGRNKSMEEIESTFSGDIASKDGSTRLDQLEVPKVVSGR